MNGKKGGRKKSPIMQVSQLHCTFKAFNYSPTSHTYIHTYPPTTVPDDIHARSTLSIHIYTHSKIPSSQILSLSLPSIKKKYYIYGGIIISYIHPTSPPPFPQNRKKPQKEISTEKPPLPSSPYSARRPRTPCLRIGAPPFLFPLFVLH